MYVGPLPQASCSNESSRCRGADRTTGRLRIGGYLASSVGTLAQGCPNIAITRVKVTPTRHVGCRHAWLLPVPALAGTDDVGEAELGAGSPDAFRVVTPVEVEGLDVTEEPTSLCGLQRGGEQGDVVPVGAIGGPAEGDSRAISE